MSRIRARETKPEQKLRSAMHKCGYRFRKNVKGLPGTPDIVLRRYKSVIFVNGCFWHQHLNCQKARMPKSNIMYWEKKLKTTQLRDELNRLVLAENGWNVITVWECEIKNKLDDVLLRIKSALSK